MEQLSAAWGGLGYTKLPNSENSLALRKWDTLLGHVEFRNYEGKFQRLLFLVFYKTHLVLAQSQDDKNTERQASVQTALEKS